MSKSLSVNHSRHSQLFGQHTAQICQIIAWSVTVIVTFLAIFVWGKENLWHLWPVNLYQLFPVLGLVAFSLMWGHYVAAWLRRLANIDPAVLKTYFASTSWVVLILICLHPSLLIYQRFRDGAGLPPHSYESYVRPGLGWVTLLGSLCLLVFLAYELHRFYSDRPWWRYMLWLTDLAMLGIFYHGLRIGDQIQHGWYHTVWWFYGISLLLILLDKYWRQYKTAQQ